MSFIDWLWGDDEDDNSSSSSNSNGFNEEESSQMGLTAASGDGDGGANSYNYYTDIYGDMDLNTSSGSYAEANYNPYKDNSILGLPLKYNDLADPNGRIYNSTIISDLPLLYMIPGKPTLNKNLIDSNGDKITSKNLLSSLLSLGNAGYSIGVRGVKDGNDLRYIGFKADYHEYFEYVQTLLSDVYSYMQMSMSSNVFKIFNFANSFQNSLGNYGLCYYCDSSTSVSESASNSYGTSKLAEQTNEKSATAREAAMLGRGGLSQFTAGLSETLKSMSITSLMDSFKSYDGIIARTSNKLFRVVNGSQLYIPEIWSDSKFDRSYNISFKFYSPYGDKMSIFKYVYVPLISLLCFTLPRQSTLLGYDEPFLIRMYAPGMFDISMGAVTDLTINKGGSDSLWTVDGLPQAVDVTMNVIDLYPAMTQVNQAGLIRYNATLSSYLETMAGVRPDQLNFTLRAKALVNRKISNFWSLGGISGIKNKAADGLYELQNKIGKIF